MGTTVEGGAYLSADGKTWHDCEGRTLTRAQISEAEDVLGLQAMERAEAERLRVLSETANNPIAQALAHAMAPKPKAEAAKTEAPAAKPKG